jgi:hypothetical protein
MSSKPHKDRAVIPYRRPNLRSNTISMAKPFSLGVGNNGFVVSNSLLELMDFVPLASNFPLTIGEFYPPDLIQGLARGFVRYR